ncbi:MAG TPA: NAD(P)H-dependent oxidoreductase [Lacunisphaera sp.]|jgi:NAD(P)H-dependent FMN reductase|nr:NAD(P)H-dependent oxidoreductase [Lacunisphaera sp.]
MKFFVLSGSHRREAQSLKVAKYVATVLQREHAGAQTHLFSLSGNPLPLWDEATGGAPDELWDPISAELKAADALVVVTPEWSGMATPGVKNFLLNCTADEIGHKPGLIVTVSASRGGSYPVAELRMSGYKNNRLAWIPEHVIIHHVEQNLNAPDGPDLAKEDATIRKRLRYALRLLEAYGQALASVRTSGVIDHQTFRSGM